MEIEIKLRDTQSLTKEEAVSNIENALGKAVRIKVMPDSDTPHDLIMFGIQQIITNKQITMFFDSKVLYQQKLDALRKNTLEDIAEILDTVIIENEQRLTD